MPSSFAATHSRTMFRPTGTAAPIDALVRTPAPEESSLRQALFGSTIESVGLVAHDDALRDSAIT
jgi:hypothetical protein